MRSVKVGSDFSGVGAFDYAIGRVAEAKGFQVDTIYACDWDKYARITYAHNHGEPPYYPKDVYEREIPAESLDIYMTSPPCQAFSLAGKRLGKQDKRGILFFNSHEFIQQNNPRFFIFENVKGLLSDDGGKTFSEWINMLGGKSVNGMPVLFPHEDAVPYHIYWRVLNSKEHGVPQNRERVFIVGIRDDEDNLFRWPLEEHLTRRLKDVLEDQVDEKYFLSEKMVNGLINKPNENYKFNPHDEDAEHSSCLTARYFKMGATDPYIKIKSATSSGYETATPEDSINFSVPNSETRRGRVGKGVAQTLDTACNQGVIQYSIKRLNETLQKHELPSGEVRFVDSYNQSIHEHSACINARINATNDRHLWDGFKIRRLTPRECFRLQDFPDSFDFSVVSDSQAYKQAGNSITVRVLEKILMNLPL